MSGWATRSYQWLYLVLLAGGAFVLPLSFKANPEIYKAAYFEVAAFSLLGLFFLHHALCAKPVRIPASFFALLLIVAWGWASLYWAIHPLFTFQLVLKWSAAAAFYLIAVNLFRSGEDARLFLMLVFVSGLLIALLAVCQYLFNADWIVRPVHRPAATFGNKNVLMHYLVLVFPLGFGLLMTTYRRVLAIFTAVGIALIAAVAFYAGTRAAFVAGGVELILLSVLFMRAGSGPQPVFGMARPGRLVVVGIALAIVLANLSPLDAPTDSQVTETSTPDGTYSAAGSVERRFLLWKGSLDMIRAHPFLGVAAGNWHLRSSAHIPELAGDRRLYPVLNAHNFYLEYAASTGVVGVLLLAAWLLLFARKINGLHTLDREPKILSLSVLIALVGAAINACFSFGFSLATPLVLVGAFAGLLVGVAGGHAVKGDRWVLGHRMVLAGLALLVLAGLYPLLRFHAAERLEEMHYQQAISAAGRTDWPRSAHHAQQALDAQPLSSRGLNYLMLAEVYGGRWTAAEKYARALVHAEPAHYMALATQVYVLGRRGKQGEALQIAQRCLEMRPNDWRMLENARRLAIVMGETEQAKHFGKRLQVLSKTGPAIQPAAKFVPGSEGH